MLILLSQSERRCLCAENGNCFQKIVFKYFKWEFNNVCLQNTGTVLKNRPGTFSHICKNVISNMHLFFVILDC